MPSSRSSSATSTRTLSPSPAAVQSFFSARRSFFSMIAFAAARIRPELR